ncbi:hypothetical protein GCM10010266_28230 [Streptomyces griseomycini]|uniref:MATE family efflux transporter n=1 Tax=Streptomyces griseomycini TaxID=66895 RepID=UPI0019869F51|nr:MATE family efflux transporter [Streptomyces griseomycini]GGQ03145.1 hypothetical protein GCM10010266_28230 [Streptomyces griseomycini]
MPLIGRAGGAPRTTLDALGVFPYLLACSVLVMSAASAATSALVGLGRGRAVMRSGRAGTGAAVVLSLVLVGGVGSFEGLGLPGAGIAMLASGAINATLAHLQLRRHAVSAGRSLRPGRPSPREVIELAGVGVPLAATVLVEFAVLGVLAFSAARVSTDGAAVHSISLSLVNLMFGAAVAVGQATVPLMAAPVEAGDVREVRRSVRAGVLVAPCAVRALALLLVAARTPVVSLFTEDTGLRDQVLDLLPVVLLVVLADAVQAVFGFGLIGIRHTVPSLVVFAVCYGLLALVALPVGTAGGLEALRLSLTGADLLLPTGQARSFRRRSAALAAPEPGAGDGDPPSRGRVRRAAPAGPAEGSRSSPPGVTAAPDGPPPPCRNRGRSP